MNGTDIELLICPPPAHDASTEFRTGWAQLLHCVGPGTHHVGIKGCAVANMQALQQATCYAPDSALVLLASHGQVVLDRVVLQRLVQALRSSGGWTATLAHDQHFPCSPAPDYCTVRGLQRYLRGFALDAIDPTTALTYAAQHVPLVALTTVGAIRQDNVLQRAAWIPGAHVHNFSDYHNSNREEVIPFIPAQAQRVLDVGGGDGAFLHRLRAARTMSNQGSESSALQTQLAELSAHSCDAALGRVDRVWKGDFTTLPIDGPFDCITFLEVLEHTEDPLRWLCRARELLTPGGTIVASVPNVGHWSVIADLIEGHWDYAPVGIHCVTHLHFFTERSLRALFSQAGLTLRRIERTRVECPQGWRSAWGDVRHAARGLEPDATSWDTYGFIVQATI
jgi:2-polyprenyl-3-methyl-5-hydroxy-6-metoxy-1,4-benzoquinol methylase